MTEQKFKSRIQWRTGFSGLLLLIGLFLLFTTLSIGEQGIQILGFHLRSMADYNAGAAGHLESFRGGYYYGVSMGITGAAIATLIKNIVLLRNEEKFRKQYIKETDERNIQIYRKAYGISWISTIFAMLIATFFVSDEAVIVLLSMIGFSAAIYFISFMIFQKHE